MRCHFIPNEDIPVNKDFVLRRSGLSGEIRPVNRVDQRIQEAENWVFDLFLCLSTTKLLKKIPE
jgi:DNA repair protein RadA/Sms